MVDVTKESRMKISPELDQEIRARIQRIRQKKSEASDAVHKRRCFKGSFLALMF
ncbi:hypothetical protein [Novacetimonas hansenii]|nr:hypothetical protein [Novacetimonas hansenii]